MALNIDGLDMRPRSRWRAYRIRMVDLIEILQGNLDPTSCERIPRDALAIGMALGDQGGTPTRRDLVLNSSDVDLVLYHPDFWEIVDEMAVTPTSYLKFEPPVPPVTGHPTRHVEGTRGVGDMAIPEGEAERFLPDFDGSTFGDAPPSAPGYISREVRKAAHLIRGGLTAFDADPCATATLIAQPASI